MFTFRSRPPSKGESCEQEHQRLTRRQHGERPARQQLELPARSLRQDQQPVGERVEQRPQAAVLAGDAAAMPSR